jgi:DNA-binding CsgD family transcriptional regulator
VADAAGELDRGRRSFAQEAWADAFGALSAADRRQPLDASDLELLATSAYMLGREQDYFDLLERAYRIHQDAGEPLAALRSAFWIGITLASRGEMGRAGGWLGRAQRLLDREDSDCVESGYMLLPVIFEQSGAGELEAAATTAAEAAALGEHFDDADLFALASHERGHLLIRLGRMHEGLALLDESMVAVAGGELSPIASGIVYCGVILACQDAHELRRAQEWTEALTAWCDRQPDLVAFTGRCRVHRSQIMRLHGAWAEALAEARRAAERCLASGNARAAGEARYEEGEVHRLAGDYESAENAYREASGHGWEPQPGLALMRLAQGDADAAQAAIRRVEAEATEPGRRAGVLPAFVEIVLAVDDIEAARAAVAELESIAEDQSEVLVATAAQAQGAVKLADGDARGSLTFLRPAYEAWRGIDAPYELARVRELLGIACRELGDTDAAMLELEAARDAYAELGAAPDLSRAAALAEISGAVDPYGLTGRELEVLRHLASGETNRAIAERLVLSVRTVDRHVSNIYAKLGVSSRAAATAHAHKHGLV